MLKIDPSCYRELRRHGEETYPHECCGVLLGTVEGEERVVTAIARAGNTRTDSPQNRYNIDPRELIAIQRQGRERGLDIVGFYHSHPDHPARWSATDLAEAHWLGCSYVITRVEKGEARETNSFLLEGAGEAEKRFQDEPLEIRQIAETKAPAETSVKRDFTRQEEICKEHENPYTHSATTVCGEESKH